MYFFSLTSYAILLLLAYKPSTGSDIVARYPARISTAGHPVSSTVGNNTFTKPTNQANKYLFVRDYFCITFGKVFYKG